MNAPLPPNAVAVASLLISTIDPSPSNPRKRFDEAYIAELAESIKSHGLIQPITVRPNPNPKRTDGFPYEIVVGECRWRATKLAGLREIPAFWRELDNKQVLEIQVIENLQRRDVHPIEEAEGYQQLMDHHGYTATALAEKIGKSRGYVYARLKLTSLCHAAREAFYEGSLDASTALLVARIPSEALQKKAVKGISTGSYGGDPMSYRAAKDHIRYGFTISLKQATFKLDDAMLDKIAGSCTDCTKRSGNAPEICADLDDADVCTDTLCFEQKRIARRQQLLANAEKLKIPVLIGEEGRVALREKRYIDLDQEVEGDGQERTYREILGDIAPVNAMVETGFVERDKRLVEVAEPTALEKALKKAGWTPDLFKKDEKTADQKQSFARQQADDAERKAKIKVTDEENAWRESLINVLLPKLQIEANAGELNTDRAINLLACASLRQEVEYSDMPEERLRRWGNITLPEEFDVDIELAKICEAIMQWPVGTALAFIFDALISREREVYHYNFDPQTHPPKTLLGIADLIGFDAQSLRKPAETASPPTHAAQTQGKDAPPATIAAQAPAEMPKKSATKKAKTKTNPAAAMPPNEPASPVKPSKLHPAEA